MAKREIRVTPVRREQIDIEKLVSGLLLLVQELAAQGDADAGAEPPAAGGPSS
jgi:hypothetical protein